MSYAIVRNEKLTRAEINGKGTHNDRKAKNHTNKDIDPTKTHLNYYIKKNELTYTKEFDKYLKENNLKGHLRSNSIIMCQMIFTSDQEFFDKIGEKETKIDVNIIVEYGSRIPDVAYEIQTRVKKSVENMTGLKVSEVNVHVQGVKTEKEVEEKLKEMAKNYGKTEEEMLKNEYVKEYIENNMKFEKAIKFIVDNAKFKK